MANIRSITPRMSKDEVLIDMALLATSSRVCAPAVEVKWGSAQASGGGIGTW